MTMPEAVPMTEPQKRLLLPMILRQNEAIQTAQREIQAVRVAIDACAPCAGMLVDVETGAFVAPPAPAVEVAPPAAALQTVEIAEP